MKIIIIGATAAGTSAAAKARRVNKDAQIRMYEKTPVTSLGGCGMPYYLGDVFTNPENLIARTPEQFIESGIETFVNCEITGIDFDSKFVTVHNSSTGEIFNDSYDKLIIASGSQPINPPFVNLELDSVFNLKTYQDALDIKSKINSGAKNVVIIGAGYIGLEVAENLNHLGLNVTVVEMQERILTPTFGEEFSSIALDKLISNGINMAMGETVQEITNNSVITDKQTYDSDLTIVAIGFQPATKYINSEEIDMLPNGAVIIDEFGQTSIKDVYAAGDCATVKHLVTGENTYIALATTASKIGKALGTNIFDTTESFPGTLGSAGIKLFDLEMLRTGLTLTQALKYFPDAKSVTVNDKTHPGYIPASTNISMSLIYDGNTKLILGAEVIGNEHTGQRLQPLAVAITNKMKTTDLVDLDLAYSPMFSRTTDIIHILGSIAK